MTPRMTECWKVNQPHEMYKYVQKLANRTAPKMANNIRETFGILSVRHPVVSEVWGLLPEREP
jgi:hypothetical protein